MSSIAAKSEKLQEMSMQWVDLSTTARYLSWKIEDLRGASNREILKAIVQTFNKNLLEGSERYSEEIAKVGFSHFKYRLKYTGRKQNLKPNIVAALEKGGVDKSKYEERKTGNNMLFFFCTSKKLGSKREIVVLSTGQAWNVVRKCVYVDYPVKVAERILDPGQITQITRYCLLGPNLRETLLHPSSLELYKTSSLYYLVESIKCVVKENASFLNASAFCEASDRTLPKMTLTTGGILRIHHRFTFEEYPDLISLFHSYIHGEETYNSRGELEEKDPRFEFLHYIQPATPPSKALDHSLVAFLFKRYQEKQPLEVSFRHKFLDKFLDAEAFEIQWKPKSKFVKLPPRPPTLLEIIEGIEKKARPLTVEKLEAYLRDCQLRFRDAKTHQTTSAPLIECLEGEIQYEQKGYFKIRGMWYQLTLDYHALVQEDFSSLLKGTLLKEGSKGTLPNKWLGNTPQNVLTQSLAAQARGKSTGIQKFMQALTSAKVCFLGPSNTVNQTHLVGEILDIKEVAQNAALIETELSSSSSQSFEERLKALLPKESPVILRELRKERSIVVLDKQKKKWVRNPITYPLRGDLGDKEPAFAAFLETLYEKRGSQKEEAYNRSYIYDRMNGGVPFGPDQGYLVFDQMTPLNIEMCDIVYYTPETTYLYHVKEKFGQDTRIACDQILNGAKLLRGALSTHQQKDYLEMLWEAGMKIRQNEGWRALMKKQLEHLGRDNFLRIFHNRKIVFVYAYLAEGEKTLQKDMCTPAIIPSSDLPKEMSSSPYLDSKNRLTGAFYTSSQETFSLGGVDEIKAAEIYKNLSKFKSSSNSTLAKLDLVRLDIELRSLNFKLKISEIEQPESPITLSYTPPSFTPPSSGSLQAETSISDSSDTEAEAITLSGLPNIRNSCYMNAALQAITYLDPIQVLIQEKKEQPGIVHTVAQALEKRDKPSLTELRNLLFKDAVYPPVDIYRQQDPLPFLGKVFEALDWAPMKIYTVFFYEVPGEGDQYHLSPKTKSSYISLMIEEGKTLQQLVKSHFSKENTDDPENPLKPEQYPEHAFERYAHAQRITPTPDLLVIHLKRFRQDGSKITDSIRFPENRRISIKQRKDDPMSTYEIVSMINHHGKMIDGGHYTADIKDLSSEEERWLNCDDSVVKSAPPKNPEENAYILFLKKVD